MRTLFVVGLALGACTTIEGDEKNLPQLSYVQQGLHPSGVCRIQGHSSWLQKTVVYYHITAPYEPWYEHDCDIWVGTSECCAQNPYLPLSYEECLQLRYQPDCPSGGGGPGGENEDDDGPL